jgi:two-component system, OmpR family, sensor histidine kinase BaeS
LVVDDEPGLVRVVADYLEHDGFVTTGQDERARIVVSDTGDGFDPATADRLFERFYRGDSSRTASGAGSGIGLTIAKAIIAAHHGTLVASSEGPGHGATFQVTLPIATSATVAARDH